MLHDTQNKQTMSYVILLEVSQAEMVYQSRIYEIGDGPPLSSRPLTISKVRPT